MAGWELLGEQGTDLVGIRGLRSEPEVLIVGAGPTGLTLAAGLLANGVAARVVDKAVAPAGTSRALAFSREGSRWWTASGR